MRATWGGLHGRILGLWVDIKSGALQVVSPDFSTVRTILCDSRFLKHAEPWALYLGIKVSRTRISPEMLRQT
ncbi:hypothetical protein CB1_000287036 [Camelus ferus]|nr:hypothetical protein CB1_000287036 [Camelus ferus]